MRRIQVLVAEDNLETVTNELDDEGVDYVRQRVWTDGDERWLVEFPVPTDAVGYMLNQLKQVGVEQGEYSTVTALETATTPRIETLLNRFADDFDPLTGAELRSKARDLSRDTRSFLAMIFLSAVIAVPGLLVGSPAVVVGSMVIAPMVGPVLTAATGAVTADREMVLNSVWLQAAGLAVAIVTGGAFSAVLQLTGFFPQTLDVASIDLIAVRMAPNFVAIAIALAAGGAGAFGLMTKGPTALIGVMIAAALIPAAATIGIATAWNQYRIAAGSLFLLLMTMVLINAAAYGVLRAFYTPAQSGWLFTAESTRGRFAVLATAVVIVVLVGIVGVASAQHVAFERTVNGEVQDVFDGSAYDATDPVTVRIEYSGGPFGSPETITVVANRPAGAGDPPNVADALDRRIGEATDREVAVRVRFQEYQQAGVGPG